MTSPTFGPVVRAFKVRSRFRHEYSQRVSGGATGGEWRNLSEYVMVEQDAKAPSLEAMFSLSAMMADRFAAAQQSVNEHIVLSFHSRVEVWTVLDVEIWEDGFLLAKWSDDFTVAGKEAL